MRSGSRTVLALLLAAVLGGGLLVSCSDDDEPKAEPTGKDTAKVVTMAEFCAAAQVLDDAGRDWARAQDAAREWQQLGVPEEAPVNVERGVAKGLQLIIRAKNAEALGPLVRRLSPQQQDDINSVDAYLAEVCAS